MSPTKSKKQQKQDRQCLSLAENIALLSLLRRAPVAPQANPRPPSAADADSGRVLSFDREVSLTAALAFISGISDDASHVVAVCVEEPANGKGIRVVVAINKEHPRSGDEILLRIKNGLLEIFGSLSRSDKIADAPSEDLVFDSIVRMCKQRIFSRVRSRRPDAKYSKKDRTLFGSIIQQVLDVLEKHAARVKSKSEVNIFRRGAANLVQRLSRLESCDAEDVTPSIKDVVRAAHRLVQTTDLDRIFLGLSPKDLNPNLQEGVIKRLTKIAYYRDCCHFLLQLARELRIFKNAEVICVSLDPDLFKRRLTVPPDCCLTGSLSRCESSGPGGVGAANISSKLVDLGANNSTFLSTVRKTLRESRVHAEVQIVCHYQIHPAGRKPRVICSSKDACYLCNLFVRLNGTFHIPRTHGNLYPGWRLLPMPALRGVQAQLNQALEGQIRKVVRELMTVPNPRLMLLHNENESTVFPFSPSPPRPQGFVQQAGPASGAVAKAVKPHGGDHTSERSESPKGLKPGRRAARNATVAATGSPSLPAPDGIKASEAQVVGSVEEPDEDGREHESPTLPPGHDALPERLGLESKKSDTSAAPKGVPEPAAETALETTPEPALEPTAELAPEPTAKPAPEPTAEPARESTAEPAPGPVPEPAAEAAPEPVPDSAPKPAPEPAYKAELAPHPNSQPTSSPSPRTLTLLDPILEHQFESGRGPEAGRLREGSKSGLESALWSHRGFEPEPDPDPKAEVGPEPKAHPAPEALEAVVPEPDTAVSEPEAALPEPKPRSGPSPVPQPSRVSAPSPKRSSQHSPQPKPRRGATRRAAAPLLRLVRGQTYCFRLDSTEQTPAFTTGLVTVYPEFVRSLATANPRRPNCFPSISSYSTFSSFIQAQIQWLPHRRAAAVYVARPRGFVELESPPPPRRDHSSGEAVPAEAVGEVDGGSAECVYLAYAGEVVMVDVRRTV